MIAVTVPAWWRDERRQALQPLPVRVPSMRTAASSEEPFPCSSHLGRRLRRDERAPREEPQHPRCILSVRPVWATLWPWLPQLYEHFREYGLPRRLPLHALIAISRMPTGLSVYASLSFHSSHSLPTIRALRRYGWVVDPYPTGTRTPQGTPSFAWHNNAGAHPPRPERAGARLPDRPRGPGRVERFVRLSARTPGAGAPRSMPSVLRSSSMSGQ
jgi:hypothetical protein